MKQFLLALVLTVAFAASLVVIVDRLRRDQPGPQEGIPERQDEQPGTPQGPAARKPPSGEVQADPSLTEMIVKLSKRMSDVEGGVFDLERNIRSDLKGMYEKLLLKLEELQLGAAPHVPAAQAKAELHKKLAEMGVKVVEEEGMLEVRGAIGQPSQPLELLATAPGGRAHETLLVMNMVPSALKIGLEDLGLTEVPDPDPTTGKWPEDPDGVYIYVLWDKLKKPRRVEDMILNTQTRETMKHQKWLFTASRFYTDTRTWDRRFAADLHKNVVAMTANYALDCILCNSSELAENQHLWVPDDVGCPGPGTKVRIFFCLEARPLWDKI